MDGGGGATAAAVPADLYPIAILIDELKHDDVQFRLNAMKRIDTIAIALGPERTRTELVPFLAESVDDEDEVILALAEQLGGFVPLVGGPEHAAVLLPPLEALAAVEEAAVRDQAVASLNVVAAALPDRELGAALWPVAARLGARDWFTSRASACGLIARLYVRAPARGAGGAGADGAPGAGAAAPVPGAHEDGKAGMDVEGAAGGAGGYSREDVSALFAKLAADDTPMVRRAASVAMPAVATALAGGTLARPGAPPTEGGADSDAAEAAAAAAIAAKRATVAPPTRDGLNVDTGDVSSAAVPPPVPPPILVAAASQEAGAAAAAQLLPLLAAFSRDEQDSVRLLAVDNAVALARLVNGGMATVTDGSPAAATRLAASKPLREEVLAIVLALAADRSWRVRWSVANRLSEVCAAFGAAVAAERILPLFERLMGDSESEVRTAAAYRVTDVGKLVGTDRLQSVIVPYLERLAEDPSEHVRAALAAVVLRLAPSLGQAATIDALLPLFLRLLKDATPQVRLNVIATLEAVNAVIGLRVLSQSLLPAILELSADRQWRVRLAIIDFMPLLAAQLGADFFDGELTGICIKWLADPIFAIRDAATENLRKLAEVFGTAWAERVILPRILTLHDEGNYLLRLTTLSALVVIGGAVGSPLLQTRLLPAIVGLAKDPVPNVRFGVAKGIEKLLGRGVLDATTVAAVVRPTLYALTYDADEDVKYYSGKALAACP